MTKLSKLSLILIASIFLILLTLVSLRYLPLRLINGYRVEGINTTYEISKTVSKILGESYFRVNRGLLTNRIEELPYIERAQVSYKDGELVILAKSIDDGIILKSGSNSYLLSNDTLKLLSSRDIFSLKDKYPTITLGNGYLEYLLRYGFDNSFSKVIDGLLSSKEYLNLIDKAEYDNNKGTGKGELRLYLPKLKAVLIVTDLYSIDSLPSSIEVIKNEQRKNGGNVTLSSPVYYELRSSQLVRLKG